MDWRKIVLLISGLCGLCGGTPQSDLYSEQSFLSSKEVLAQSVRVRTGFNTHLFYPYMQIGSELMVLSSNFQTEPNSSYLHLGPGLRVSSGPFSFHTELRLRHYYKDLTSPQNTRAGLDFRAFVVFNHFWEREFIKTHALKLFFETYSELTFTSADSNNIISTTFVRPGIRYTLFDSTFSDLFIEPYCIVDRVGHSFFNMIDLKPSLRIQYEKQMSIGLIFSYVFTQYISRSETQKEELPHNGIRVLVVIGAKL